MASRRILYISGSIGLGHAGRDLAIARELRQLDADIEIVWLAGDPARRLLAEAGETLLPESAEFAEETGSAEAAADGFSLNIVNFAPFAMIYDFVGMDATTWSPLERLIAAYRINWLWSGGPRARPPSEDLVLFIGEPEDVADRSFGLLLPNRRDYAPVLPLRRLRLPVRPGCDADQTRVRAQLGYDERPLIVCAVGGTAVGGDLLRLCAAAYPQLERRIAGVRMVLVCGPRLDPTSVAAPPGVGVRGYVPRLYEHLAARDLAVVQAGGTTTLELTALRRFVLLSGRAPFRARAGGGRTAGATPRRARAPVLPERRQRHSPTSSSNSSDTRRTGRRSPPTARVEQPR